jgi:hypothetical protein
VVSLLVRCLSVANVARNVAEIFKTNLIYINNIITSFNYILLSVRFL